MAVLGMARFGTTLEFNMVVFAPVWQVLVRLGAAWFGKVLR